MADPIYFAPLRVPLVDTRTGLMSREWYLFFQALWLRTGGVVAPDYQDVLLLSSQPAVGDIEATKAIAAVMQVPEQIASLQAIVAELKKGVDALTDQQVL